MTNQNWEERWVRHYTRSRIPVPEEAVDWLVGQLDLRSRTRVVDVGCGPGWLLRSIAGRGIEVIGIDRSAAMLRRTQSLRNVAGIALYRTIAEYLEGCSLPTDSTVYCQSLHIIPPPDVMRLVAQQSAGARSAVVWMDREPYSPYDDAVNRLRRQLRLPKSQFNNFYSDIGPYAERVGLRRVGQTNFSTETKRTNSELASYLCSQSHIAHFAKSSGIERVLLDEMEHLLDAGPHRLRYLVTVAILEKLR